MNKNKDLTTFELLKMLGMKSETKLRNYIHSLLEDDDMINLVKKGLHKHLNSINSLQKNTETIAQQLNLPTKNDVTNIAKLSIQIEEKIDALEEKVHLLSETLQNPVQARPTDEITSKATTNNFNLKEGDAQITNEIAEIKRLLTMNLISNGGNLTDLEPLLVRLYTLRKRGGIRD